MLQAQLKGQAMCEQHPTTQTMKISDVKIKLSRLVHSVYWREPRVLVEKSGIPVAAIISANDLERLSQLERERAERFKVIDELREAFKDAEPEEIEREADRAAAEASCRLHALALLGHLHQPGAEGRPSEHVVAERGEQGGVAVEGRTPEEDRSGLGSR
jgi:prevent-host-death family protein